MAHRAKLGPVGRTHQGAAKEPQPIREQEGSPDDAGSSRSVRACPGRGQQLPGVQQIFRALQCLQSGHLGTISPWLSEVCSFLFFQFCFNTPHLPKTVSDLTSPITAAPLCCDRRGFLRSFFPLFLSASESWNIQQLRQLYPRKFLFFVTFLL